MNLVLRVRREAFIELEKQLDEYRKLIPSVEDAMNAIPDVVKDTFTNNGLPILSCAIEDIDSECPRDWVLVFMVDSSYILPDAYGAGRDTNLLEDFTFHLFTDGVNGYSTVSLNDIDAWIDSINETMGFVEDMRKEHGINPKCSEYGDMGIEDAYREYVASKGYVVYKPIADKATHVCERLISDLKRRSGGAEVDK